MAVAPSRPPDRPILRALRGEAVWPPPAWIMRQAGRYLPEYRDTRAKAGSFLRLCYTPTLAAEVTLQPIRRYGFDAAIIFSDILVVPDALGCEFRLDPGEGPRLRPVTTDADLSALPDELPIERLEPVFEALGRVRAALPADTTLLGFCGAPWTVASYMVAGQGTLDQAPAHEAARRDPAFMDRLLDLLVRSSVTYLLRQLDAGADAVQIFESHAGSLAGDAYRRWSLEPIGRIVAGVRAVRPGAPIIVFPRGRGDRLAEVAALGASAVGIDQDTDLAGAVGSLPGHVASQGNVDPGALIAGGDTLDRAVDAMLEAVRGRPHIANLGHGITPPTPPENVGRFLQRIRSA